MSYNVDDSKPMKKVQNYLYFIVVDEIILRIVYLARNIYLTTKSSLPTSVGYVPVSPLDSNPKLRLTYNQISPKKF